jgi:hypothetical protein
MKLPPPPEGFQLQRPEDDEPLERCAYDDWRRARNMPVAMGRVNGMRARLPLMAETRP